MPPRSWHYRVWEWMGYSLALMEISGSGGHRERGLLPDELVNRNKPVSEPLGTPIHPLKRHQFIPTVMGFCHTIGCSQATCANPPGALEGFP